MSSYQNSKSSPVSQHSSPKGKDFWGPPIWTVIHIFAITLKPENAKYYQEFLWLMTKLIPCDYCKKNLIQKLEKYPPEKYLTSSSKAFLYSYIIHDMANQHISRVYPKKKPKVSPSLEIVKESYLIGLKTEDSKFWGPPVWATIHILTVTLRSEDSNNYEKMMRLFTFLLPCQTAKSNLSELLKLYNIQPYLRNNHDAFFYSYMMHDFINKKIGKVSPPF